MTVYLDTSVVLRVLFHEPDPAKVRGKWDKAYSSNLWRVEALRTVDRLRLSGDLSDGEVADLARDIRIVHETLSIQPLNVSILRASDGSAVPGDVTVQTFNLTAQLKNVTLRRIDEPGVQDAPGAIYYIGVTPVANRETLKFYISVTPEGVEKASEVLFIRQFSTD